MKNLCLFLALSISFLAWNQSKSYPQNFIKVLDAHGGTDLWDTKQSLKFTVEKPDGNEVTTTDLKSRKSFIDMPKHAIGYNGENVWLLNKDTITYKGKPKFYYNLMFYFYAMPFVLADDGIMYGETEPLVFEGKSYPGIKIAYQAGVGESPDDEYRLYYDPETFQMAWLAYTVTFFSRKKGKEFHFIKYGSWQEVDGLLLPDTLSWYHYEDNKPTTKRNDLKFTQVELSEEILDQSIFEMPSGANLVE